MVRTAGILLALLGAAYGGYSLLRPGDPAPPLSSPGAVEPGGPGPGAGEEPRPGPGGKAPAGPEVEELIEQARAALERAGKATDRTVALEETDRARALLSRAYLREEGADRAGKLWEKVEELNRRILFTKKVRKGKSVLYRVEPGDILYNLCHRKFPKEFSARVAPGFLLWLNGLKDPRRLREGQLLKVPLEELSLRVSKHRFRLWVLLGGVCVKGFPVGIGADDSTPEGEFEIETKIIRPAWYNQVEGRKIPYGDPANPLGTRWLGFRDTPDAQGYGIHGTSDPSTVGKDVSRGCIRLKNRDVELLFEWVPRGTRVRIVP